MTYAAQRIYKCGGEIAARVSAGWPIMVRPWSPPAVSVTSADSTFADHYAMQAIIRNMHGVMLERLSQLQLIKLTA